LALKKALRYFNFAVAALVVAAAAVVYWFAWRPLPRTSGRLEAPIRQRATVERDHLGVPHISAASVEDALFAQGFVTAQDRLWQMDSLRRWAAGRLSEVAGPQALQEDRRSRALRLERIAEEHYRSLSEQDRAPLAAYARGVNFFIQTHRRRLPLEFTLMGYEPRPWRVIDSILVGLQMYQTLTNTWEQELKKDALLAAGDKEKVNFLYPVRAGSEVQPGSNAWVLAGSRTASGRPLLAGDPHLAYSIPGIWYLVHLKAPGLHVAGAAIPGLPCVILGHNDRIAWGVTNLQFDVQDLYQEKLDLRSGRYVFRGRLEQARLERDVIPVRGSAGVEFRQWVTRHGPIVSDEGNRPLALRWGAAEPGAFQWVFLDVNRAGNWQEFTAALARYPGPGQNFIYADVDGNIGYQAAGRFPIRKTFDGDVPVDGASGDYEWEGFIPFEELPRSLNPPAGLIVTANQNPFPANYPYRVNGKFDPPYRAAQIHALLTARGGWRADQFPAEQKDVYSAFAHLLAREFVSACERRKVTNPALTEALALLRAWNGQMEGSEAAPFIVTLGFQHLRKNVAERAAPRRAALYDYLMAPVALEKLLRERPAGWFEDWDRKLVEVLADALEEGRRMQGRDVRKWRYGHYHKLLVAHPVGHRLPLVGKYFNLGPVPLSGSATTIKKAETIMGYLIGPSLRLSMDVADWDRSLAGLVAGQSGHLLSHHYKDQWDAYQQGRAFPMQFRRVEAAGTLVLEPGR